VVIGQPYRDTKEIVHIFEYDIVSDSIRLVTDSETIDAVDLSPGGAILAGRNYDSDVNRWNYQLFDMCEGLLDTVFLNENGIALYNPNSDWSPDGKAILAIDQGIMYLYDLESGRDYRVQFPQPGCYEAIWVNPD